MDNQKLYTHIRHLARRLRVEEAAATAVEYGLMVALIAAVIIGAVSTLGTNTEACFDTVATAVGSSTGTGSSC